MKNNFSKNRTPYPVFLCLIGAILLIRCRYGFDWSDECYYTTLIYRLANGGKLFSEMWELHQLSVIPLYLPGKLFLAMNGSTEGMILFFRVLFCIYETAVSIVLYFLLKKEFLPLYAFVIGGISALFTHFALPNFSYDSMAPLFLLLCWALWAEPSKNKHQSLKPLFAGFFYALAVQCYPQAVLTFPVMIGMLFYEKKKGRANRDLLFFIAGLITLILLFSAFVLLNSTFSALTENLTNILDDPTHTGGNTVHLLLNWFHTIIVLLGPAFWVDLAVTVCCAVCYFKGKQQAKTHSAQLILLPMLVSLVCILLYDTDPVSKNNFLAICFMPLYPALFFLNGCRISKTLWLYLAGILFSLSAQLFSNMGIYAASFPLILSSVAEILLLAEYVSQSPGSIENAVKKSKLPRRREPFFAAVLSVLFLFSIGCFRVIATHRESSLENLTSVLASGPAKGIHTTKETEASYSEIVSAAEACAPSSGNILVSSHLPFGYMLTSLKPAAQSVWNSPFNERLVSWYAANPDSFPDMILTVEKGIGFSGGNGNIEDGLQFFSQNGSCYTEAYSSDVCSIYLKEQN